MILRDLFGREVKEGDEVIIAMSQYHRGYLRRCRVQEIYEFDSPSLDPRYRVRASLEGMKLLRYGDELIKVPEDLE